MTAAAFVPATDGAAASAGRRRRAAALRFCVDLDRPPLLRAQGVSEAVFWVDVDAPRASAAACALRAAVAPAADVDAREREGAAGAAARRAAWTRALAPADEARVTAALLAAARGVSTELWAAAPPADVRGRAVMDYQISQLSRLIARLSAAYDAPAKYPWRD